MTITEELTIIEKRIPDQKSYILSLNERYHKNILNKIAAYGNWMQEREAKRALDQTELVKNSARGVLVNLLKRKEDLENGTTGK